MKHLSTSTILLHTTFFITSITCLATAVLHSFWAVGGTWGRSWLAPKYLGRQIYRQDAISNVTIASLLAFMALNFAHMINKTLFEVSPLVQNISFWLFLIILVLRAIGDFRYVGLFQQGLDPVFYRRERRLVLPVISFWVVATMISLYLV